MQHPDNENPGIRRSRRHSTTASTRSGRALRAVQRLWRSRRWFSRRRVAVKELQVSYHKKDTLLSTMDHIPTMATSELSRYSQEALLSTVHPHYGNLNYIPQL